MRKTGVIYLYLFIFIYRLSLSTHRRETHARIQKIVGQAFGVVHYILIVNHTNRNDTTKSQLVPNIKNNKHFHHLDFSILDS